MSSSASKRSTTIPLSCKNYLKQNFEFYLRIILVDRFRIKSIQFLSPFRIHHCDKQIKQTQGKSIKIYIHTYICKYKSFRSITNT